ncbi:MAG: TetR/AcrR family transcriptional regulator [Anaerolineae bacterium]|nr:TetR/AcrR family transcriptional regulator [Anaerolineae bacterium]
MIEETTKGDQARAEILEAARQLFLSRGYHGTSMRAIATAAGDRAVAGIYNHFPTKEAIFAALIEETNPYDQLFTVLNATFEQAATGPEFVQMAFKNVLGFMPNYIDFVHLAQIEMREFDGKHIDQVLREQAMPYILDIVSHLQQLPGLKPFNTIVWMRLIASLVIGYMITEQITNAAGFDQIPSTQWADMFAEMLLHGVSDQTPPAE